MAKNLIRSIVDPFLITHGKNFRLRNIKPRTTLGFDPTKVLARQMLHEGVLRLAELQEKLYAQDQWGVLLVFQAMDAAGKDGVIRHVMSGVNPQGCQVFSFKAPSSEELDHDYLWRTSRHLPERGRIGIFNRSYYEEVIIVRVHSEILARQKLPPSLVTKHIWRDRYEDINAFERYLARNGYVIRKFFLHISRSEQQRRFLKRLDEPEKNWKFSFADAKERNHWGEYMRAYEDMIRETATPHAPWIVVPGNKKWFARWVVAAAVIDALQSLKLAFPIVSTERKRELAKARIALMREESRQ
jgi:PPK2 family polyphosphate:nucleotide phosphotransferase